MIGGIVQVLGSDISPLLSEVEKESHFFDRRGSFFIEGSKADLVFSCLGKSDVVGRKVSLGIFSV